MYTSSIVILSALVSRALCFNQDVDDKFHKLPRDEFIKYFNSQNFTWKIQKYNFEGKVLDCAEVSTNHPIPIKPGGYKVHVPKTFDATEKWPECSIRYENLDQGSCGSCWAIAASSVASARSCILGPNIKKDGPVSLRKEPVLSTLDLACCTDCFNKSFCSGGSPERAALFWVKHGLVTSSCKPYSDTINGTCKEECVNETLSYKDNKHFGENIYIVVADDLEIRGELVYNGPLIATFALYEDLKDYKSGIYEHTYGKLVGYHSVQVIGYGVENEVPYWLVTNTWGMKWGESGVFKVKRFQKDLGFEKQMISLFPKRKHCP
ncbi:unnamed protein product [Colias eurytheme]|nr:unnamed protein product [Colias eurytheme]